jgi:acyl-CoA synthetase (AMP-forming)/AMP-acid ligase II
LKTGDIGYCDERTKKWYIIDRKKELIKVRGFQVAPPELEGVLLLHPQIVDAAVIGLKGMPGQPADLELPRAYIVRRPGPEGEKLTADEVKQWCGTKLAKYKELTGGVVFLDAIPKNASGKILKTILRDMAKDELKGAQAKL